MSAFFAEAGPLLLIVGSALTAPLFTLASLTLTGDRLLGLGALGVAAGLGVAGRLRWTPIHSGLAVFVGAQVLTTVLRAPAWPQGVKFVTVYLLGFSCFALAAEWARGADGQRRMARSWVAVGAILSVAGTLSATLSNFYQEPRWGSGLAQVLLVHPEHPQVLFAAKATFNESNLFSSFLLIPFTIGLWAWHRDTEAQRGLVAELGAMVFGLASGTTRAAWVSMAGIIALWWWVKRPRGRQLAALGLMLALAFLLQAAALRGTSPLATRVIEPVKARYDQNMAGRLIISRGTVASWRERPVLGQGAGSVNRIVIGRGEKTWNGNLVLFVLHDSGLLGLAALVVLGAAVWRRGARALRHEAGGATPPLAVPLLAVGAALCFAYQFTHGLWIMYPYVYLGVLTAATDDGGQGA